MEHKSVPRRKGGRPSSASTAKLREDILVAAERTFLEQGFSGASVEAIAMAAGTSKQTVYTRFGTKERLFVAVSDSLLGSKFAALLPEHATLRDKLLAVAVQMLDAMLDPKMVRMHAIIAAEAERFPDLARAVDDDDTFPGRALILQVLADAEGPMLSHGDDLRDLMRLFQDMVLSAPLRSAALNLGKFDAARVQAWAVMAVDVFLDGIRPR
ncbi:putative TetR family transcriptional regulator [Caenibius tardaugens NBRC 16725]|uniref:Putative TetR family transcriptional regulator n=1 Tax=Caenibius tardaugens NBRC 16725 TaxID=1219035 RepID=U2Y8H9_9SPHN|nr:TetR/AcrR family transcriptional regulator [Caenibius tardaugens]AZI36868.1 TetR/AcrR family transcriptional regulator [Caenibius tardaugens NBRC 16725]GAD49551.1 putative TetR family transcriptional regulator [Caenibius tardaugens NBRC 16725]